MITIVDYKAGNLTSVKRALDHLGIPNQISADPEVVRNAERVIFPGVGAAGAAMGGVKENGLVAAPNENVPKGAPILCTSTWCPITPTPLEAGDPPLLDLFSRACNPFLGC